MRAEALIGEPIAKSILDPLQEKIDTLHPALAIVQFGARSAAASAYTSGLQRTASPRGITTELTVIPPKHSPETAKKAIERINARSEIHGIIVMHPFSKATHDARANILSSISPEKDVDCMSARPNRIFNPATPTAVMRMLDYNRFNFAERTRAIVFGTGSVGGPLVGMLMERGMEVVGVDKEGFEANGWQDYCKQADLVIATTGNPEFFVTPEMIGDSKPVIIDIAVHGTGVNGDIRGEVTSEAWEKASYVTPVPGGVGTVTRAVLLEHCVQAADLRIARAS